MRVFLDQGVPRRAAEILRQSGVEALHAAEAGLSSAHDAQIVAWCREGAWMAVTLDADFHAIVALSGKSAPSTVRIRIEGLKGPAVAELVRKLVETRAAELTAGALVSVDGKSIRVRRLPIARSGRDA